MKRTFAPRVEIDDLQPTGTCKGYHASWQEGTLIAHAWLDPIDDQPAKGFVMEFTYNHKQINRRLSEEQIDTCMTLVARLREFVMDALRRAGWQVIGQQEVGSRSRKRDIWQHSSRISKGE
jgi:hypothetical protein